MRSGMRAVLPAAIASGSLVAQHVAGKATRDTLFLAHFGVKLLPAAMIGAALVSALAVVAISRALARFSPARLVPAIFALAAVLFLLEWWLSLHTERGAAVAVYVHTAIFSSAGVSAFWSLVNERFDPHVAKKVVGQVASGGTLGGILGGVLVWQASDHLTVPMMLALLAGVNVIGLAGTMRMLAGDDEPAPKKPAGPVVAAARPPSGWKVMKSTPYLRDLALLVLAGAVVQALLDWLLSAQASAAQLQGPRLLSFFALFNMVVGVASFVAQAGLARPVLERLGLSGTVKSHPAAVALFGVVALVFPVFSTVIALRGAEAVLRNSLYRSAYELFYTPIPTSAKRATKTLVDVGADRIGTALGSVALLGLVQLGPATATRAVVVAAVATAVIAWVVATRLHDGYVAALAASLKSGAVALDDSDAADLTTRRTLAETTAFLDREKLLVRIEQFQKSKEAREGAATSSDAPGPVPDARPDPRAGDAPDGARDDGAAHALAAHADPLMGRVAALRSGSAVRIKNDLVAPLSPALVPFAIPLLADDAVVRDAVRALRRIAPRATGQLLDALLDVEGDPRVRRRLPRVLKVCRTPRAASGMLLALRDPVFDVRVQVALALAQMQEGTTTVPLPRDEVLDAALHELSVGRASWHDVDPMTSASKAPPADVPREETSGVTSARAEKPVGESDAEPRPSDMPPAGDAAHRGLAHTFTVLGLVLEREPLSIAYRALRSDDTKLRGTASEYLEVVLPPRLRDVLVPLLGEMKRPGEKSSDRSDESARDSKALADELLRSNASLAPLPGRGSRQQT